MKYSLKCIKYHNDRCKLFSFRINYVSTKCEPAFGSKVRKRCNLTAFFVTLRSNGSSNRFGPKTHNVDQCNGYQ